MPSRFLTALILLFWAGTSAWFFYSEIWPRFRGGDAPPFVIDLADEARRNSPTINWDIIRADKTIGQLRTSIVYHPEDDSFDLMGSIHALDLGKGSPVQVSEVANDYRVTREGKLLDVNAAMKVQVLQGLDFKVDLHGQLDGNVFKTTLKLESPVLNKELNLAPVRMSSQGSALNPLHPVDRIHGLALGKRWHIALIDPIRDALAGLVPGGSPEVAYLQARVLPSLEVLNWGGKDQECFVIEYKGDSTEARTWVLASDGRVLRQEARFQGEELVLERVAY